MIQYSDDALYSTCLDNKAIHGGISPVFLPDESAERGGQGVAMCMCAGVCAYVSVSVCGTLKLSCQTFGPIAI